MALTSSQLTTLKNHIAANNTTIPYGGQSVAIKDVPNNGDGNFEIAKWYNLAASPAFLVWKSSVSRSLVYHSITAEGTVFDWSTFKGQPIAEQNAWVQMFMGDTAPFNLLSFRNGVFAVFSGSGAQNLQRAHIFNCGRRSATNVEKLLAIAVAAAGGISPVANNGNTLGDALGAATNPAFMTFEGAVTGDDIELARNS